MKMAQFPVILARKLTRIAASLVVGILAAVMLLYSLSKAAPSTSGEASPKVFLPFVAAYATNFVTIEGNQLILNGQPFKMRGVNYYSKDHAWDDFWISYTQAITDIDHELCFMEGLGVNALRIFLRWKAFTTEKNGVVDPMVPLTATENLKDFIARADDHGMKVLITLFDGITTSGTTSLYLHPLTATIHLDDLIPEFVTDTRIIGWDIKNEPDRDYYKDANGDGECGEDLYWADPDDKAVVQGWVSRMISEVKTLDPNHLVTVGPYAAIKVICTPEARLVFSPTIVNDYANAVDFVSVH
jgi:endo-1,4-beta-mannosidase